MAASLDSVLASIPGYGGYLAKRKYNEDQQMQQLQQMGAIGTVFGQLQSQADQAKIKEILDKGSTPEETFNALVRAGPSGAAAAHQYATGLTQLQTMKNLQSLQGVDLNTLLDNPQKEWAAINANPHIAAPLERLRAVRENARQLETLRGTPAPIPTGTQVPGTNQTTLMPIPPEDQVAFGQVASGQQVRATAQPTDIAPRVNPELARLSLSTMPGIPERARALNQQLQSANPSIHAAETFTRSIGDLSKDEARLYGTSQSPIAKLNADLKAGRITPAQFDAEMATKVTTPEHIENMAQLIANRQVPALSGYALRSPVGAQIMSRVSQIDPKYQAGDFQVALNTEKRFTGGKEGGQVKSFNVGLDHLGTLRGLVDALDNGNLPDINRIAQEYAKRTGQPAPTNFDAAKKIVGDEIVKAIVGAGGGVSDREEIGKSLNRANSPAQLKGVIDTYIKLMKGQLGGLQQQYEAGTRKTDFRERFLSPAALSVTGNSSANVMRFDAQGNLISQ
jgi:hypothetical protein